MYNQKTKVVPSVITFFCLVGLGMQLHTINELNDDMEELEKNMNYLEQDKINAEADNEALSHQLSKLEKEYRELKEEFGYLQTENEDLKIELDEKKKEIEELKSELVVKREREEVEKQVAEAEKEEGDKTTVLSTKNDSKSEQNAGSVSTSSSSVSSNRTLGTFKVTSYAIGDGMTPSTVTANGTNVANTIYSPEGHRIIAVDTSVIPMNTVVRVTMNGNSFLAKSSDTGSAIKGNKIDLLVNSPSEAINNGVQEATIEIVN